MMNGKRKVIRQRTEISKPESLLFKRKAYWQDATTALVLPPKDVVDIIPIDIEEALLMLRTPIIYHKHGSR